MKLCAIPPVRRAVPCGGLPTRDQTESLDRYFDGRPITVFGSGTQALTAALTQCWNRKPVPAPNAILPAYGCPDLVSACLGAGVMPVLVDVSPERWGYDLRQLDAATNDNTVAIIAVNLLGLPDAETEILKIARAKGAGLISDFAQNLPRSMIKSGSDFQVFSFGRGKPLNLLGGGALVGPLASPSGFGFGSDGGFGTSRLAGLAFNLATRPCIYPWLQAAMGGSIGGTRYRAPEAPMISRGKWLQLAAAMPHYLSKPTYSSARYSPYLAAWRKVGVVPLESVAPIGVPPEPIRLGMLARDRTQRDGIVTRLNELGLGASALYGTALPEVVEIPEVARCQGPFPNADSLANRLFTLPTHQQVSVQRATAIDKVIREVALGKE